MIYLNGGGNYQRTLCNGTGNTLVFETGISVSGMLFVYMLKKSVAFKYCKCRQFHAVKFAYMKISLACSRDHALRS